MNIFRVKTESFSQSHELKRLIIDGKSYLTEIARDKIPHVCCGVCIFQAEGRDFEEGFVLIVLAFP